MEKKMIIIKMDKDATISITKNPPHTGENRQEIIIPKDKRTIKALDIYNLLQCENDTKYSIDIQNDYNKEDDVLKYFKDLLYNILKDSELLADSSESTL